MQTLFSSRDLVSNDAGPTGLLPPMCVLFPSPSFLFTPSLPRWKRLHLDSAYPRRRSPHVRTSFGTLEPRSERREGASQRDFDARRYAFVFGPLSPYCSGSVIKIALTLSPLLLLLDYHPPALEPNLESGANIDCCKLYRDNYAVRGSNAALRAPAAAAGLIFYL